MLNLKTTKTNMHWVINKALLLTFIAAFYFKFTMAGTIAPSESAYRHIFATNLFSVISDKKSTENIVFSPASIQTSLALTFIGAEGKTAEDMRKVLKLGEGDKKQVLENYGEFLKTEFKSSHSSDKKPQLKMVNRMYVNKHIKVAPQFNEIARDYFDTVAENTDFSKSQLVVNQINHWVSQQTDNKIENLLQADAVNAETSALLINAIHFKAKWLKPFSKDSTMKSVFHANSKQKYEVDTMFTNDRFKYVELPELDAKAIEMPYEDSNMAMLIVLPNDVDGLNKLEAKLQGLDLNEITSRMFPMEVDVFLPKFRIEFDIDLKEPLEKLGLKSMFNDQANFTSLFDSAQPQKIDAVKHKAFLDVNEAGSEAAAATVLKIYPMSLNFDLKRFRADHPFLFAIHSENAVYFAGHLAYI